MISLSIGAHQVNGTATAMVDKENDRIRATPEGLNDGAILVLGKSLPKRA